MNYREFLKSLHDIIRPSAYVEIGIREGAALTLASCIAVGIDPNPKITFPIGKAKIFSSTSDEFFDAHNLSHELDGRPVDLAFIDGFHNFEFALRDFTNIEPYMASDGIVVIDDVRPRNASEAGRAPTGGAWTGDVWKIFYCLKEERPDLALSLVGTTPTGLLVVRSLNPKSSVLSSRYDEIFRKYVTDHATVMPPADYNEKFSLPDAYIRSIISKQGGN